MGELRSWIMGIAGAAVISALAKELTPKGKTKAIVCLACGLVTLLCLVSPFVKGGFDIMAAFENYHADTEKITKELEEKYKTVSREVIQSEFEAYISHKGKNLGISDISAKVKARWNEAGYWYPDTAEIISGCSEDLRQMLEDIVVSELGIPREKIYWSSR